MAMSDDDGQSCSTSSDLLAGALADANDDETPEAAAMRQDRDDLRNRGSKGWRKRKRINKQRKTKMAKDAVKHIQKALGRRTRRTVHVGRRIRKDSLSSGVILDLAFGAEDHAARALPSSLEAGARSGVHKYTARRARTVVLNCLMSHSDKRIDAAWARVSSEAGTEPVAVKFQWDETALRMYLPLKTVERLFPFPFAEAAAEAEPARHRKGSGSRPCFNVQVMQAQGAVMLGEETGTLFVPAKIVHSTAASDLYLPIQLFLPLAQLQALPLDREVMLIMNGDSFKPNKLIIRHLAEQVGHPTHDGLCFGRFRFSTTVRFDFVFLFKKRFQRQFDSFFNKSSIRFSFQK